MTTALTMPCLNNKRNRSLWARSSLKIALVLIPVLTTPATSNAQDFPVKPIQMVVPFAAGGATDVLARTMAESMGKTLGQPIIVVNKPGAATVIGNSLVAKSPSDGHSLLLTTTALTIVPYISAKLPYASNQVFEPITLIGRAPNVVVVRSDSKFKSLKELVSYAGENPGKLNYGSSGAGSTVHLAAELLNNMANIKMTHVPYKGGSQQITDLLAGHIDVAFSTMPSVASYVQGGELRALAVTSATREKTWPTIPAVSELVPGYEADVWFGVLGPAGINTAVVNQLHDAIVQAAQSPLVHERAEKEGVALTLNRPQEFRKLLAADEERWRTLVKTQTNLILN